jgi:glycosyltransferase involved in cell wall biosynthesis
MSLSLIEQVRRVGLPAVFSIHNDWLVYAWKADQWTRLWQDRPGLLRAAAERVLGVPAQVALTAAGPLLFNSRYTLTRARAAGIDVSDATVIHPGIDTAYLDPVPQRGWTWRLLYVGRLDRFKGVDTALHAIAQLPAPARLDVHGKGDPNYERELRDLAHTLGVTDRVTFGPFATRDELRAIYTAADAVVFPVRGEEPWGLVPLEAMGLGRPVVSTARGGTAEFVHDGHNALVIEPDDPTALATAVIRLAGDPGLRQRLTAGGAETAARHTAARFNVETVDAIEAAAGLRATEPELVAVTVGAHRNEA